MERLTTNKDVSEMSMIELAYNSCYAKDNEARYRDFDSDFNARELAIKLLDKYAEVPNEFTCDDDFDDFMLDSLQYGTDTILGLIAIFYRNLWAMADLRERLKEYEDLEGKGIQEKIINMVIKERKRQDVKWGEQNHVASVWGMIIGEEYGEMCQAINEFGFNPTPDTEEQIYTEAIHTMASCMAMLECIERRRAE